MSRNQPKGSMTAAELMAELEADPEWRAERDQQDREHQRRTEENRRDAAPVVADLAAAGFEVDAIADLFNRKMSYEAAVPVLLDWLPKIENPRVKGDIVRALTVSWARPQAARPLIAELRKVDDPSGTGLRWTIANALAEVADDSVFAESAELARDRSFGRAREMLMLALANMHNKREQAIEVLRALLADQEVAGHAVIALGKIKASEARAAIEPFTDHSESWVREEAKKALARIGAA